MSEQRVLLDAAAFMDSPAAVALLGLPADDVRAVVRRVLASCYDDVGKAPRLLEGDDLAALLLEHLPRRFGVRDPLAELIEPVLGAFLEHLGDTTVTSALFELRTALGEHAEGFRERVRDGVAHRDGVVVTEPGRTVKHRAERVGRNDPCPCGSGKKFKKCCMRLGDA